MGTNYYAVSKEEKLHIGKSSAMIFVSTFFRPKVVHISSENTFKAEVTVKTLCGVTKEWFNYKKHKPSKLPFCYKCACKLN